MNKVEASKAAKHFFKTYPSVDTFHVTEDGQFFHAKHDADAHASTINKKEPVVHVVERDAVPASDAPDELTEEQKKTKADADAIAAEEKKAASIKKAAETKAKNAAAKAK